MTREMTVDEMTVETMLTRAIAAKDLRKKETLRLVADGEKVARRLCEVAAETGVDASVSVPNDGGDEYIFIELREVRGVFYLDLMSNDGREICSFGSGEPTAHCTASRAEWVLLARNLPRLVRDMLSNSLERARETVAARATLESVAAALAGSVSATTPPRGAGE